MTAGPAPVGLRPREVLFVLPPDFSAPADHGPFRFPPLGPAIVAASIARDGFVSRAVDLALDAFHAPLPVPTDAGTDRARVEAHLAGAPDPAIDAVVDALARRLDAHRGDADLVAFSVERASQLPLTALLTVALKRRWGLRIIVGGAAVEKIADMLDRSGAHGADMVTGASSPPDLCNVFHQLSALPAHRVGPALRVEGTLVQLGRAGLRQAPSAAGWPLPDFGIYDLPRYRRDPVPAWLPGATAYRGDLGPSLVLPWLFTFECQFSCAFCQTGGNQTAKPADHAVRELATLAERYDAREFLLFDTQINLVAADFSRALLAAGLDLRWSDSFRVSPRTPGDLALMARAGCASLTVGVESASDRVLKLMVKGQRAQQATELVREAHALDLLLRVNLLSCFPGERAEDFELTRAWVRDNAYAIDDLAPSSFYLTADSPLGRDPARYGIRIRDARPLGGESKFRKSTNSLTYDEVDGLTWEQREPLLAESERLLLEAWHDGREGLDRAPPMPLPVMVQLRRRFATKADIAAAALAWAPPPPDPEPAPELTRPAPPPPPPLRARPVLPRRVPPPLAHAFACAFEPVRPDVQARCRPGDVLHALLFADGGALFFRGAVTRDAAQRPLALTLEDLLAPYAGPAAPADPRPALLLRGAALDAAALRAVGAPDFELLTVRLEPASPRPAPAPTP